MLLRVLLLVIFCVNINLTGNAVGNLHPSGPTTFIPDQKVEPKNGIFKRLQSSLLSKKIERFLAKYTTQKCDIIVLKNGDQHDVKVVRITNDEVQYTACDDGEDKKIKNYPVSEVFMVNYANGDRFVFKEQNLVQVIYQEPDTKGGFSIGFLLGLLLGIVGLMVIIVGFKGERRRNATIGALIGILFVFIALFQLLKGF